jgi:hypothetical protein
MSEERRKRKQEREGTNLSDGKAKKMLTWAGILLVLGGTYYGIWYHQNHKYDALAKCIATKDAKMYGLYWCPHCIEQKEMFGESFHYVPYVECAIKGTNELAPACKIVGVKEFPSWQFSGEQPKAGVLSLDALSDKTGCSLP